MIIARSTDIRAALASRRRQRGFFTLPGGMGAARPAGGGGGGGGGTHRYWRIQSIMMNGAGNNWELNEFQLLSGSTVLSAPIVTASAAPAGGNIAALSDQNSSGSLGNVNFSSLSGLTISWDFGRSVQVDGIKLGAYDNSTRYPSGLTLQYSDDGSSWTSQGSVSGLSYPGNNTLSAFIAIGTGSSHRYWRIASIASGAGTLEISELQMWSSTESVKPVLTAQAAVNGGLLGRLSDGNTGTNYGLPPSWTEATVEGGSFYLQWDFGANVANIDGVKFAGYDNNLRFPAAFSLAYSDDGSSFTVKDSVSGLTYPGNFTLTSLIDMSG